MSIPTDHEIDSRPNARTALESAAAHLRTSCSTSQAQLAGLDRTRIGSFQHERLREWAREFGFISEVRDGGGDNFHRLRRLAGSVAGNEHSVIFPQTGRRVIKFTHRDRFGKAYPIVDGIPSHTNATPLEYLNRLLLSNLVFSDDVRLERVLIDEDDSMSLATSQPLVVGTQPDEQLVHQALRDLDFEPFESVDGKPMTNDWFRERDQVLAFDAHSGNFIETGDGIVLAIDIYVESVSSPEY